jgi:hypothetical protein
MRFVLIACASLLGSLWAADPDGAALYQLRCAACHDNNSAEERALKREQIAARKPEAIVGAMFDGAMIAQASGWTLDEGRAIARFITGKEISAVSDVPWESARWRRKNFHSRQAIGTDGVSNLTIPVIRPSLG